MAVVYRIERKKIVRSQLHLVEKILCDLEALVRYLGEKGAAVERTEYQVIIMKKTE